MGDIGRVADDQGHRHRLAEGTAGGQGERAEDAGAGTGHDHLAQHLPTGGAEGHRPFDLLGGHHRQHVLEMATMVGSTITKRMIPANSSPTPSLGPLNSPVHPRIEVRKGSTSSRNNGASTISPHRP